MDKRPTVSLAIPIHNMERSAFFLARLFDSLQWQTFKDYEIVISQESGTMAYNSNCAIQRCRGEIVKVLYMDDYFTEQDSLKKMVDAFKGGWLVTGCLHDDGNTLGRHHIPSYNHAIHTGNNTIGSPSVLMFENKDPLLFDGTMNWLLDCDLYKRLYERYGEPTILEEPLVILGVGTHQTTYKLTDEEKQQEVFYSIAKHAR